MHPLDLYAEVSTLFFFPILCILASAVAVPQFSIYASCSASLSCPTIFKASMTLQSDRFPFSSNKSQT